MKVCQWLLPLTLVAGVWTDGHTVATVSTNIGVINGFTENITVFDKTSELHTFLGIPFAEPPVGDLRFKKPVPKSQLNGPLDAFAHKDACLQGYATPNVSYSEDCLYLNIYAPDREDPNVKLPVMVWIYGGGFHYGESNGYIPDHLSVHGDVIVVTFNYRLSIYGFLSTGDNASPGNYGLWDQRLALQWVHDNIVAFGGDPDEVTIFGQSAGSASVIHQGLYTGNHGLFQRAVGQSGTVSAWFGNTENGPENAIKVGQITNCSATDSYTLVQCLKQVPAQQLINLVSFPPMEINLPPYAFLPVKDGDFIKFDPKKVFESSDTESREAVQFLASLDLLAGVNVGEGVSGLDPMFGVQDMMTFLPNRTDFETRLVPLLIKEGFGEEFVTALSKVIISEYTNWSAPDDSNNIRDEFLQMHADFTYNAPLYHTLNAHAQSASAKKTYMYYLDFEPETNLVIDLPWYDKAVHGDDVPLVFGYRLNPGWPLPTPTEWELKMARQTMTMWTNFAKTGDPNSPNDLGLDWEPYTTESRHYLQITRNMTSSNVKQRWNIGAPYFWSDVIGSIIELKTCGTTDHGEINSALRLSAVYYTGTLLLTTAIAVTLYI